MNYTLTAHAKKRMTERSISRKLLQATLRNPTKVSYDDHRNLLLKMLYRRKNKERLLLIVGNRRGDKLNIITVIDTSKVKKYL